MPPPAGVPAPPGFAWNEQLGKYVPLPDSSSGGVSGSDRSTSSESAATSTSSRAPGIPNGSTNYGSFTRNFFLTPTGETVYEDTPNGKPEASNTTSRSSSTSQSFQDPRSLDLQAARDAADKAHQEAVDALAAGDAAEAKRKFDVSAAETQRYHDLDLAIRRDAQQIEKTKFAYDAYTKLQDLAANPRNFLQSFFLQRGEPVPQSAQGGTATNSGTTPFTSFLPSFLGQMGLGNNGAAPSSGSAGGGGAIPAAAAPVYSPGLTEQAANGQNPAIAEILKNQASGSKVGMLANGGVISEPIIGFGTKSGQIYHLGEEAPAKPETVVPKGKTLADVQGKSGHAGSYDTGGELGYAPGTQDVAGQNKALMQLLNSLSGTAQSKTGTSYQSEPPPRPPSMTAPATLNLPQQEATMAPVPASPYNTFGGVQTQPNLAPLYSGTATNTPLQQFQSQGAVPPFLQRILGQNAGNGAYGTNVPQQFALPPDVPLVSSIAYSQMTPSEQQALLSYVSGYGVSPEDYLGQINRSTPQRSAALPRFLFNAQQ